MDVAMTTNSTLWSGLAGPFLGRRDEGAGPRQTPREGQGLGAGGWGHQAGAGAGGQGSQGRARGRGSGSQAGGLQSWGPPLLHM